MANKATGKARGRPKTKEYVTMLARVPAELADLVKRYAGQHGQIKVSELIREGLEWRVGDGDPRGTGMYLDEPVGIREQVYDSNTGNSAAPSEQAASVTMLQEIRALVERQGAQMEALTAAIEHVQTTPPRLVNTGIPVIKQARTAWEPARRAEPAPPRGDASADTMPSVQATVLQAAQNPALASVEVLTFDTAKHHLGSLCRNKDEWGSTGQSLRNADNQCLACKARTKREKAARQREKAARQQEKWHAQPVQG